MQFPTDWFSVNCALNIDVWLIYYKYPSLGVSGMQEIAWRLFRYWQQFAFLICILLLKFQFAKTILKEC